MVQAPYKALKALRVSEGPRPLKARKTYKKQRPDSKGPCGVMGLQKAYGIS